MTVGQSRMFHFNFKIRKYETDCQGNYVGKKLARGTYSMRLAIQAIIN